MITYNNNYIGLLANGIWQFDLNSPSNLSPLSISGYIINSAAAKFNNLCNQCYIGVGYSGISIGNIIGDSSYNYDLQIPNFSGASLGDNEGAILRAIFMLNYYENLVTQYQGQGSFNSSNYASNITSPVKALKEGDSAITFESPASMTANIIKLIDQKRKELFYLSESYRREILGSETPRSCAFFNISSYPYGPGGGWGTT